MRPETVIFIKIHCLIVLGQWLGADLKHLYKVFLMKVKIFNSEGLLPQITTFLHFGLKHLIEDTLTKNRF